MRGSRPDEIFRISDYFRRWSDLRDNKLYIRTNLQEANLKGAKLWISNLQGADLQGANLKRADLWLSNLQRANLKGADLSLTNLQRTNLKGAKYNDATQFPVGFNPEERGMVRANNFGKKKRRKVKKKSKK